MNLADEERLSRQVDQILKDNGIESMLECRVCRAELTLRTEVIQYSKAIRLSRVAYNCEYCLAMNVVWVDPGLCP